MNEVLWLAGIDPVAMLDYIAATASDRKLRLFACACLRRYEAMLKFPRQRRALEFAEQLAEGVADVEQRAALEEGANMDAADPPMFEGFAYLAAAMILNESPLMAAQQTRELMRQQAVRVEAYEVPPGHDESRYTRAASAAENREQCRLLRELFGNPFRPVPIDRNWLRTNGAAAGNLARDIREENRFEDTPYLADALMDAGCGQEMLLAHLRERTGHVRGCWAIDALLELE